MEEHSEKPLLFLFFSQPSMNNRLISPRVISTPLYDAVVNGTMKIDDRDKLGFAALHECAYCGLLDKVKDLVSRGANVDIRDRNGRTPISWACQRGFIEVVQFLIEVGSDINICDIQGFSPLSVALINDYWDLAKLLQRNNADFHFECMGANALDCSGLSKEQFFAMFGIWMDPLEGTTQSDSEDESDSEEEN